MWYNMKYYFNIKYSMIFTIISHFVKTNLFYYLINPIIKYFTQKILKKKFYKNLYMFCPHRFISINKIFACLFVKIFRNIY